MTITQQQKLIGSLVLVCLVVASLYWLLQSRQVSKVDMARSTNTATMQIRDREHRVIRIKNVPLEVEVVTQQESITLGLSGRAELGADGMLFVFPQRYIPRFWMKEMQFDLDLVWIDGATIVDITEQVPKPQPNQTTLPTYSPQQPVSMVLELPAGTVRTHSFAVGDEVLLWNYHD